MPKSTIERAFDVWRYVIVHVGFALSILDYEEAERWRSMTTSSQVPHLVSLA